MNDEESDDMIIAAGSWDSKHLHKKTKFSFLQ